MSVDLARLADLVQVGAADVYKSGRLAAWLRRDGATTVFGYRDDYLSTDGRAVATTLPRSEQPVITTHGAIPPFFAGLLPEGRRLTSLRRVVKTSADDELSLVLAVGSDPVGDVQIFPAGAQPEAQQPLLTIDRSRPLPGRAHRAGV